MQMKKINSGKLRAIGYDGREIKGIKELKGPGSQ